MLHGLDLENLVLLPHAPDYLVCLEIYLFAWSLSQVIQPGALPNNLALHLLSISLTLSLLELSLIHPLRIGKLARALVLALLEIARIFKFTS